MLFSIIIPTYNRSNYLERAVVSALAQEGNDYEVIVMDNASSDGTEKVMKQFLYNKKFKYVKNNQNIGMIANWQKGVEECASGEWVLILSDDDRLIDNNYLENAKKFIDKYEDLVIIHANRSIVSESGRHVEYRSLKNFMDGSEIFINYLKNPNIMFTFVTGIFKRELSIRLKCFSKHNVVGSDTMEFLRMALYGKVAFIDDVVAEYRIHENNPYYRFGFDYLFTENIETFELPYKEARSLGVFDERVLGKWKNRLITQYISSQYDEVLRKGKGNFLLVVDFVKALIKHSPSSLKVLLYPKNIALFLLFGFRK